MASEKYQLSAYASADEAEIIKAAAKRDKRSVAQWLLIAALEKAEKMEQST